MSIIPPVSSKEKRSHRRSFGTVVALVIASGLVFGAYFAAPDLLRRAGKTHAESAETGGHDHESEATEAKEAKPHAKVAANAEEKHDEHGEEGADEHDHEAEASTTHKHKESESVKLSETAQKNVSLSLAKVERRDFYRTISVPGKVVERPGRSIAQVSAPLTGTVTKIFPLLGETIMPGQVLFSIRLSHEEVVEAQTEFLRSVEELEVVNKEILRLEKIVAEGAIPGKTLLERKYERQKLEASQKAQRQRLLLHGLSEEQIASVVDKRELLRETTILAPQPTETLGKGKNASSKFYQLDELKISEGQYVRAGDPLCTLSDYSILYIQGKAFEQDMVVLERLAGEDGQLTAKLESPGRTEQSEKGLRIAHLSNKIDPESRAFNFYVTLPNQVTRDRSADGHRFSDWRYKPGQSVELRAPAERWKDRIVLPAEAVVQDGAESYVFEQNEGHFDRRSVHVEYRDSDYAVVADDGSLTPGKTVAGGGAYQIHLSLKNKSGGAPDPHAGHNH